MSILYSHRLMNVDKEKMTADFSHISYGQCKLNFIDTESEDTGEFYIEPYIITFDDGEQTIHIELLDTDITFINLYEVLQSITLHHKCKS